MMVLLIESDASDEERRKMGAEKERGKRIATDASHVSGHNVRVAGTLARQKALIASAACVRLTARCRCRVCMCSRA